nr:hypothetical protein [Tanacetum cinerariifolium]
AVHVDVTGFALDRQRGRLGHRYGVAREDGRCFHRSGCRDRRGHGGRWRFRAGVRGPDPLLQQLFRGVEHLQARAATHHASSNAQLGVADAETGLAVRALGDEAVGHAGIRGLASA